MKSANNLLEQLKTLPYFEKTGVVQLAGQYGLAPASIDTYISRFMKRKEIVRLKRGMYIATDFLEQHRNDASYQFYLANIVRTPSYISSWTALQYYNLTTEAIRTVTCVSPKNTRTYRTKTGTFEYRSIQKELFNGFVLKKGNFDFFIATPSKALFDLLYFKTYQFRGVHKKDIDTLIEGLRIDIDDMEPKEHEAFYTLIKRYL